MRKTDDKAPNDEYRNKLRLSSRAYQYKVRKIQVTNDKLIFIGKNFEKEINLEDIEKIGIERSFNKILVILTIAVALLTLFSQDLPHLITLLITLAITLAYREENVLIKVRGEDRLLRLKILDHREIRALAKALNERR